METLENHKEIAQQQQDKRQEGEAYLGLGSAHEGIGEYQTAMEHYRKAHKIARELGDRKQEGQANQRLGVISFNLGRYEAGIAHFREVLEIVQLLGDKKKEGEVYEWMGDCNRNIGQYHEAIDFYQTSKMITEELGDKKSEGSAKLKLENTIDCFLNARNKAIEIADKHQKSLSFPESGYSKMDKYESARERYQKALNIAKKSRNKTAEGKLRRDLGVLYFSMGQYEEAIECYKEALKIVQELGDKGEICISKLGKYSWSALWMEAKGSLVELGPKESVENWEQN